MQGLKRTVLVFILRESSDVAKISAGVVPTTLPVTIFFCLKGSCLLSKIMKKDITYYRFQLPPACQT